MGELLWMTVGDEVGVVVGDVGVVNTGHEGQHWPISLTGVSQGYVSEHVLLLQ